MSSECLDIKTRAGQDIYLPELNFTSSNVKDIEIKLGKVKRFHGEDRNNIEGGFFKFKKNRILFYFENAGYFSIQNGRRIVIEPKENLENLVLHNIISGTVFAFLLYQRGYLVLHASTVTNGKNCISFLGSRGWGKSTTAAYLCSEGYSLIADDLTIVSVENEEPVVIPLSSKTRLHEDAISLLKPRLNLQVLDYTNRGKFTCNVNNTVIYNKPLPLKKIFVLNDGKKSEVKSCSLQEAMLKVAGFTYWSQIIHKIDNGDYLKKCAMLADKVNILILKRAKNKDELPAIKRLIEQNL